MPSTTRPRFYVQSMLNDPGIKYKYKAQRACKVRSLTTYTCKNSAAKQPETRMPNSTSRCGLFVSMASMLVSQNMVNMRIAYTDIEMCICARYINKAISTLLPPQPAAESFHKETYYDRTKMRKDFLGANYIVPTILCEWIVSINVFVYSYVVWISISPSVSTYIVASIDWKMMKTTYVVCRSNDVIGKINVCAWWCANFR